MASRYLQLFVLTTHLLAAVALVLADLPAGLKGIFSLVLASSAVISYWRQRTLNGHRSIRKAVWQADNRWRLGVGRDTSICCSNWRAVCNYPGLILLQFQAGSAGQYHLLLCGDSIDRELHRQLRVRLTRGAHAGEAFSGTTP